MSIFPSSIIIIEPRFRRVRVLPVTLSFFVRLFNCVFQAAWIMLFSIDVQQSSLHVKKRVFSGVNLASARFHARV